MTTKAEELARQHYNIGDTGNIAVLKAVSDLTDLLEQYGRLVQEAAAEKARSEIMERMHGDYPMAHDVWNATREMPLP